jgi:ketosteroid isomerase-like protein
MTTEDPDLISALMRPLYTPPYKSSIMMQAKLQENKRLMQTLDDAWNSQDWDTFNKRHSKDVAVYWPGQPEPTRERHNHEAEAREFFKTFPDNHLVNDPYKVLIADGDHTCSVAEFTGTMMGPMRGADGKMIPPTNKSFKVEFCTVAHWKDGEITEERLFYDLVGLMKQIGLM